MRITLNLSPPESARDRYALAWAIPATVVGLVTLIFLGRASLHEYRDYREKQGQLVEYQKRTADLHNQEMAMRKKLEDPVYHDLLQHARFVNKLIAQRELSLTEISARLAGLLPEDARLTALALAPPKAPGEDYSVRMAISAKNEDAIETFINDLEDSSDFKDVSIINQGFQEDSSQPGQVNVMCTARYLPAADVATEKTSAEKPTPNSKPSR